MTTVLHVAPHPDDEAPSAPCTLLRLKDAGARMAVMAVSLGRPAEHTSGRAELEAAATTAERELVVRDSPAALVSDDDVAATEAGRVPGFRS